MIECSIAVNGIWPEQVGGRSPVDAEYALIERLRWGCADKRTSDGNLRSSGEQSFVSDQSRSRRPKRIALTQVPRFKASAEPLDALGGSAVRERFRDDVAA